MTATAKLKQVHDGLKKKFSDRKLVFGTGAATASVVLVSEKVTAEGKLLDPKHERLLNRLLRSAGVNPKQVYLTATVKYAPNSEEVISPKELKAHASFLKDEIHTIAPQIVVTLGTLALNGVGMRQPLGNVHGRPFNLGSYELLPTYHPEHALRDPDVQAQLEADFTKLKELVAAKKANEKTA